MSKFIKNKQVKTITGKYAFLVDCKLIAGSYYKMGVRANKDSGDVFFIEEAGEKGKWFRVGTGYLIYDYTNSMYMLRADLEIIIEGGIVGFEKNNDPIFGNFSRKATDPAKTIVVYQGKSYICINEKLVSSNPLYKESLEDGWYYERNAIQAIKFVEPVFCSEEYKRTLPYDSRGRLKELMEYHKNNYVPNYYPQVLSYHKMLGDATFGVEFETVRGLIPEDICNRLGLLPLRDGSIRGIEYVTIPLKGKEGLQSLIDSLKELKKRTRYNTNCALHMHIGNVPRTEEFFLALFKVLFRIQDDMYSMFPLHKHTNYGVKKKHYTKPLPLSLFYKLDNKITKSNIKQNFNELFRFLSMGMDYDNYNNDLGNVVEHPSDPNGNRKWGIRTRYYWVNLIPLLFGNKETIEFRIHTPTYETNKIVNFLFLCTSIIDYVKDNTDNILKNSKSLANLTLESIIDYQVTSKRINSNIAYELSQYMSSRRKHIDMKTRDGDLIVDEDTLFFRRRKINWNKRQDDKEFLSKRISHYDKITSIKQEMMNDFIHQEMVGENNGPFAVQDNG